MSVNGNIKFISVVILLIVNQGCNLAPRKNYRITANAEISSKSSKTSTTCEKIVKSSLNKNGNLVDSEDFAKQYSTQQQIRDNNKSTVTKLSSGKKVYELSTITVKHFDLMGNTAISNSELSSLYQYYLNRPVTFEDLQVVTQAITKCYIGKGYINSGAILADQIIDNNVVKIKIKEGKLSKILVEGNKAIKPSYIENEINKAVVAPLNLYTLRTVLLQLEQDSRITQINAHLLPGNTPGESLLRVKLKEDNTQELSVSVDNHRPPSVGSTETSINFIDHNLTGRSDTLEGSISKTKGLKVFSANYNFYLDYAAKSYFAINADYSDALIIEEPFNQIDITSKSTIFKFDYNKTLKKTLNTIFGIQAGIAKKHSESALLEQPFSFSVGAEEGKVDTLSLYAGINRTKRTSKRVISFYSSLRQGLPKSINEEIIKGQPSRVYVAVTAQALFAQRLPILQSQFSYNGGLQISDSPLLSVEKFSIGGVSNVRGYRENQIVRDNGFVSSFEWKIPLTFNEAGTPDNKTAFLLFFDYGVGKNYEVKSILQNLIVVSDQTDKLSSVGIGLNWRPNKHWLFNGYYASALTDVPEPENKDLQDKGIHFELKYVNIF